MKSVKHKGIPHDVKTIIPKSKTKNMQMKGKTFDSKEKKEKIIDPRDVLMLLGEKRKQELKDQNINLNLNGHPTKSKIKQEVATNVKPKMRMNLGKTDIITNVKPKMRMNLGK